jgi:hypothetical protein
VDDSGSISEEELLESPLLKREENRDIRAALQAAFGCDVTAMEKALVNFSAADFGVYCQWEKKGGSGESKVGCTFDRKASVLAVFTATRNEAAALKKPESFIQADNSTVHDSTRGNVEAGRSVCVRVSKQDLTLLAEKEKDNEKLASALTDLARPLLASDVGLNFLAVKRAARRVPRVTGQRVDWARGIGLDAALARQLPPGTLEDGLAGVREMPFREAMLAVNSFLDDAKIKIYSALVAAKTAKGSRSAAEANSKFAGFQGSFASLEDFHAGAEKSLNLGYPNPDTMKGILNEHTQHPSVERLFKTPNYSIITSLTIEYAFAMYEKSPADPSMKKTLDRAYQLVRELVKARDEVSAEAPDDDQLLFPGEVGDSFSESFVILSCGVSTISTKTFGDKAKAAVEAAKLLKTSEEEVRGITILDQTACVDRIRKGASVRRQEPDADQNTQHTADLEDDIQRVGVLLPMSLPRAEKNIENLRAAVAAAVSCEGVKAAVTERTWTFSRFTGVKELRRWLEEKSLKDLQNVLAEDGKDKEWSQVLPGSESELTHEGLCDAMVASFVHTELRADLRSALERGASDAHVKALLTGWRMTPHGNREDQIKQATDALDSEKKWGEVEAWVRLYRGRIQGRTRLGLKVLMERVKEKLNRFGLTNSEVLGLYLYTGPNLRFLVFLASIWFQNS